MRLPLLALLAIATPALAAPKPAAPPEQPIGITLTNHGILPARIPLVAGRPYALTFANRSDRTHDFAVRSFFQDAKVAVADLPKLDKGRVELRPGERTTIHVIAPRNRGGRYEFSSTRIEDANSGLKGNILIR